MQYEILCKHCHKKFAIESEGGETLRCKCPYCSNQLIVATPSTASPEEAIAPPHEQPQPATPHQPVPPSAAPPHRKPTQRSLGVKVTIVFTILMAILLIGATILYFIFSAISQ